MTRRISTLAFVFILSILLILVHTQALAQQIYAYVTMQHMESEVYNGLFPINLCGNPEDFYELDDILPFLQPNRPYYIAPFPSYDYVAAANFRFGEAPQDGWARVLTTIGEWQVEYRDFFINRTSPHGIAVTEINSGIRIIASHSDNDEVGFYNEDGHLVEPGLLNIGDYPMGIDISAFPDNPSNQYAFVANRDKNTVSKIALFGDYGWEEWSVGLNPIDLRAVVIENQWRLYVVNQKIPTNPYLGRVVVLDQDGNVITTIPVGSQPMGVDNAPARSEHPYLYVANYGSKTVDYIDMRSNLVVGSIDLEFGDPQAPTPVDVAIAPIPDNNGKFKGIITESTHRRLYIFNVPNELIY